MPRLRFLEHSLAHWFGCGLLPRMPGTFGSLGAVPLHLLLATQPALVHAGLVLGVSLLGIWVAERASRALSDDDPQEVVIDEVAGTLIALGLVRELGWGALLLAVFLFRVLDITKPPPISHLERLRPPGLGIMSDDLLAGLVAGALSRWVWLTWLG